MDILLATKSTTPIIGQIATLMGWIMDGIYRTLSFIGIRNIGLCIIIFSIIIYLLMTPLQIKQQKFSKLSAVMQPEIQKIQKKYQGKRDQDSMQRMQEETQAIYQKYGVSPTGSCVQLAIQLPILWALWQVIYKIPAYVGSVYHIFDGAVEKIMSVSGFTNLLQTFITDNSMSRVRLVLENEVATDKSVVDFLYALSPAQWAKLEEIKEFSGFTDVLKNTAATISPQQNFFGLNIAEQPMYYIRAIVAGGSIALFIAAILIPILSWATQMLNIKLMPQASQNGESGDTMANSMKTMNMVMPLMSAFFCLTFPVGLGIYWISSAVVRSVQQILINRHLSKIDMNELINENMKKMEKKREKQGLPPQKITTQAHQNTRSVTPKKIEKGISGSNLTEKEKKLADSYEKARNAKPGSITAKANMVRDFDERNKKK